MYPEQLIDEVKSNSKTPLQMQIESYQRAFLAGIKANMHEEDKVSRINCLPVGTFPTQYKKLYLKGGEHEKDMVDLSTVNVPILKQWGRYKRAIKELEKWLKTTKETAIVLVYTQYLPYMKALSLLKKKYRNLRVCVIVTDLPKEWGLESGREGAMKKAEDQMGNQSLELLKAMDAFVLLTEAMKEVIDFGEKPYLVLEGMILPKHSDKNSETFIKKSPVVLYTGTLNESLGIVELMEAFELIPNVELWICGGGIIQNKVEQKSRMQKNIRYLGCVSQQEAVSLQQKADVLINPRMPKDAFTRYSFPSKTLEYMRSGKPVLCYKLEGIPNEYDKYLQYISDMTPKGIADSINEILSYTESERKGIGERAKHFIETKKTPEVQGKRLMDFLRELK